MRKEVPYLQKESKGYQFNYTGSSLVLGSLKTKMDELGLLLIPRVVSKEVSEHETAKGGKEYFTELCMEFTWINADQPEETIVCSWYGQGLDNGEKGVGKAMTYAEKYFMLKFFNIATDKDDPDSFQQKHGEESPKSKDKPAPTQQKSQQKETPPPKAPSKISSGQRAKIFATAKEVGWTVDQVKAYMQDKFKVTSTNNLTVKQASEIIEYLSKQTGQTN